jgi:hypothetical protein
VDLLVHDLKLVEMLSNKLAEVEKKKNVLRTSTWKKKVQEMEKAVRHLEEGLEGSKQESMERSFMNKASGETLRMLHRQIVHVTPHDEATVGGTRLQMRYLSRPTSSLYGRESSDVLGSTTTTFGFIQNFTARLPTPSPGMVVSEGYRAS